ncbi:MAG: hypothetical protein ACK2U3_16560, partial [Anaerolineales bacterium]
MVDDIKPLNILYVTHGYKPAYRLGGPVMSVSGAAEELVSRGHKVVVYTSNSNLDKKLDGNIYNLGEKIIRLKRSQIQIQSIKDLALTRLELDGEI